MTKEEYRAYIASEDWQRRRKAHLQSIPSCRRCGLPRWLAITTYDQDLHLHHKNYENVGHEKDEDLEALCRRCHELESFGVSKLHPVRKFECLSCGAPSFDQISQRCERCKILIDAVLNKISDADSFLDEIFPQLNSSDAHHIAELWAEFDSRYSTILQRLGEIRDARSLKVSAP